MQPKNLEKSIKQVKEASQKRNFKQNIDLIFNLKDLNLKKNDEQVDLFASLHYNSGKKIKICALVGPELKEEASKNCDLTIAQEDFPKYAKDKKAAKKLAKQYDFFIAQANIMPQAAQTFGKVFGVRGKMPNPKAGCVVPPKANLKSLVEKLKKTVRIIAKIQPLIQVPVGSEDMTEAELADNIMTVYNQLIQHLPNEKNNIKSMFLKTTMGPCFMLDLNGNIVKLEEKNAEVKEEKKEEEKPAEKQEAPVEAKPETKEAEQK